MKVVIIAGANREGSTSTKLSRYLKESMELKGHEVSFIDLHRMPLPFYSPDTGNSGDPSVAALQQAAGEAEAIVLSTPEYHGGMTGVLKNALDHLASEHFEGKAVLSISSSGGAVGVSALQQLQVTVRNVHGINCPEWISIGGMQRQFDELGRPTDEGIRARVQRTLDYFLTMASKL